MRWQVHGTDAVTGRPMTLGLDEAEAVQAVHSALSKKILVTRIRRVRVKGVGMLLGFAVVAGLLGLSVWLYEARAGAIQSATAATNVQVQTAADLATARETIRMLRGRELMLEAASSTGAEGRKIVDELSSARDRIDALEAQVAAGQMRTQVEPPKGVAPDAALAEMREQLEKSEQRAVRLDARIKDLETQSRTQVAALKGANKDLGQQLDTLKSELLIAAAKSTVVADHTENSGIDAMPVTTPGKWALATRFTVVADYLNLHFDKDTIGYATSDEGNIIGTGVWKSNAATIRVVMDREKERVFSATLTVSLAADGPKDKLAENTELVGTFVRTFGAAVKDPDAWIAGAVQDLAEKGANERLVLVSDECMITVWNVGGAEGVYHWKIEPSGNALGE